MNERQNTATIKITIMRWVLLLGILVMLVKFAAYFLTHSNAILTDAIESVINVLAGGFALYSMFYALRPKDESHPYGHGKIEFLSAGFEGGMITIAGIAMIIKGIVAFFKHEEVDHADIGAYLSAFAGVVNYIMGSYLLKNGKRYDSALMIADGKHLISDTVSSIGLVIGLFLIYFTKLYWIDYVITLLFGGFITYTGFKLVRESITNLLDKADRGKLKHLVELLNNNRRDKWIDLHNLRVLKYGSHLHVDCHITLPWYDSLEDAHSEVSAVEKLVRDKMENDIEFFIHADPCIPISCSICSIFECKVRQEVFHQKLPWTLKNVLPDKKHTMTEKYHTFP